VPEPTHGGDAYDEQVTARYLTHRHAGSSNPNTVMEEPAVLDQLGDASGLRVLDLGCGDGSFAPTVLARGAASYLGVDGSPSMVRTARATVAVPSAAFQRCSIEDFDAPAGSFDLVTSRMALHYVADVATVLRTIHRLLTTDGRLIFTVVHPVITSHDNQPPGPRTTWTVDRYFEPGPRPRTWFGQQVTWHHRTIETYVCALRDAGFSLDLLSECEPRPGLLADDADELARRRRVPLMLLLTGSRE
jgi:ubiquinone/menaquinone biosynthesis C-methylase UbiE